ncbi:unnamed protein product [Cladocopium goreaui]|uniref:Shaggy-related protein kinase GSK2 (Glycoge n synthase kinase3-like protein 2) (OsGSK2) (Shaggy/GSK3-like kinase 22) (OsSK22) n=1 Tax=Cladocopium goreaui TaxID=2562237 RepID=A0A9P1CI43_9DINO|nr:unnamed protein product [Cladocopium goreaui]
MFDTGPISNVSVYLQRGACHWQWYSAHIVETNETVAIKKVFVDRRYRNRELQVWREMHHPNIVTLKAQQN